VLALLQYDYRMDQFVASVKGTLNKYAEFKGVATRSEYWYFVLASLIADLLASVVDGSLSGSPVGNLLGLLLFIPSLAVAIRRMHDTDHRGWFILVPIYNIILLVTPSRPNRWAVGPSTFGWSANS
jgi:uncharacterized membrane protein YhaH (DUF805 family)